MRSHRSGLLRCTLAFLIAAVVAGCEHQVASSPPVTLPVLERAVVVLRAGPMERVLVPTRAVTMRAGIAGVFIVGSASAFPPLPKESDGQAIAQARFRMVKVGKTAGDRVEILSGLAGTETLVIADLPDLHDGSPIIVHR